MSLYKLHISIATCSLLTRPLFRQDCLPCHCDVGGSYRVSCDKTSGLCPCRPHTTRPTCDRADPGYYVPYPDWIALKPENGDCAILRDEWFEGEPVYVACKGRMNVSFEELNRLQQANLTW